MSLYFASGTALRIVGLLSTSLAQGGEQLLYNSVSFKNTDTFRYSEFGRGLN